MFRASPWISYEPSTDFRNLAQLPDSANTTLEDMEDADMDAPQISTLREEETPPPQPNPTRTTKFRVKLVVNDTKGSGSLSSSASRKQPTGQSAGGPSDEDEDEEEDQLIDDDEPTTSAPASRPTDASVKRKPSAKRRPRKSDKQDEHKQKLHTEPQTDQDFPQERVEAGLASDGLTPALDPLHAKSPPKKKTAPRKSNAAPRPRKSASKLVKPSAIPIVDDAGGLSEGYTGTAASSPVTIHHEPGSPEPENIPPPVAQPLVEDFNLDSGPLPIYPLPSKPFPVQPPPKIGTGFAPIIPIDKSQKKVRHWRTANREIRGIAGGRWFARTWVGEKESEYASMAATAIKAAQVAASEAGGDKQAFITPSVTGAVVLPKLSAVSISAPPSGKGSAKFKVSKGQSASSVGPSSRGNSVVPDLHAVRAPTKMRTILAAPSFDAGNDDVDMAPPEP